LLSGTAPRFRNSKLDGNTDCPGSPRINCCWQLAACQPPGVAPPCLQAGSRSARCLGSQTCTPVHRTRRGLGALRERWGVPPPGIALPAGAKPLGIALPPGWAVQSRRASPSQLAGRWKATGHRPPGRAGGAELPTHGSVSRARRDNSDAQ